MRTERVLASTNVRAYTLVELLAVLAIVALAAGIVVPRLPHGGALRVDAAAWQLAERLTAARERAILAGRPERVALDRVLPSGVEIDALEVGGSRRAGAPVLELGSDGDALPARVVLAGAGGARADVVLPPGLARARVVAGETP
jgi:prepilin-type N-terminal cleavage/methylation domain-containing protein